MGTTAGFKIKSRKARRIIASDDYRNWTIGELRDQLDKFGLPDDTPVFLIDPRRGAEAHPWEFAAFTGQGENTHLLLG